MTLRVSQQGLPALPVHPTGFLSKQLEDIWAQMAAVAKSPVTPDKQLLISEIKLKAWRNTGKCGGKHGATDWFVSSD